MAESLPPPLPWQQPLPPIISRTPQPPPLVTHLPWVLRPYRWWCVLFCLIYLAMAVFEVLVARGVMEPPLGMLETLISANDVPTRAEIFASKRAEAPSLAIFMAAIALVYAAAVAVPRQPAAWTFGLIVLCTTIFPFVITAAISVPLIVYWARPETKRYFNRPP